MHPKEILLALLALATLPLTAPSAHRFALGANFNENLHAARLPALDATGVTWIRGFLPATEFLDGPRRLLPTPRPPHGQRPTVVNGRTSRPSPR